MSIQGNLEWAAWLVLWCVLLDKADGSVARLLNATSDFGLQMDSLVDLVAFGVAPAALIHAALSDAGTAGVQSMVSAGVVMIYVVCVASRLALYNVSPGASTSSTFRGIPSTLGGAIIASAYLTWSAHIGAPEVLSKAMPALLLILGGLMISPFPLPKVAPRRNKAFNILQAGAIVATYIIGFARILPEFLFAEAFGYLLVGLCAGTMAARRAAEEAAEAEAETAAEAGDAPT